jgi:mediator of RNA polymerase II transcription subunit 22
MQQQKSTQNLILKSYEKKVKEDIGSVYDNLTEILKLVKSDDENGLAKMTQNELDTYQIEIRTSNIIKATESLTKIVSDLKDLVILNDFKSINSQITSQCAYFKQREDEIDKTLTSFKDNLIPMVNELQQEYYSSNYK